MFHNRAVANVSKNDIDQYLMLALYFLLTVIRYFLKNILGSMSSN
jgi:hypothetical protein